MRVLAAPGERFASGKRRFRVRFGREMQYPLWRQDWPSTTEPVRSIRAHRRVWNGTCKIYPTTQGHKLWTQPGPGALGIVPDRCGTPGIDSSGSPGSWGSPRALRRRITRSRIKGLTVSPSERSNDCQPAAASHRAVGLAATRMGRKAKATGHARRGKMLTTRQDDSARFAGGSLPRRWQSRQVYAGRGPAPARNQAWEVADVLGAALRPSEPVRRSTVAEVDANQELMDASSSRTTRQVDHVQDALALAHFARAAQESPWQTFALELLQPSLPALGVRPSRSRIPPGSGEIEAFPWE